MTQFGPVSGDAEEAVQRSGRGPDGDRHHLSIVIPAYNEEAAIRATIERTLAAREEIRCRADLAGVEVIVVDDGSTDRTGQIAGEYAEVRVVRHERNRGYGAAIQSGFACASGDLLGFLDADGTCDPAFFAELCSALDHHAADVAVGSRLGRSSRMPTVRRLGNRLFTALLRLSGSSRASDSASGMRVLRRAALARLYPLPQGMEFTPAITALALFDPRLRLVEMPMPYHERLGRSKLRLIRDGLRFFRTILDTALTYRPFRLLGIAGLVALALGLGYGMLPLTYYVRMGRLEEWMIYRLVAVTVALTVGVNLLAAGLVGQRTVELIHEDFRSPRGFRRVLDRVLLRHLLPWGALAALAGVALNWSSLLEYARTGRVTAHWIYVLTGGLLVTLGAQCISFGILARMVGILRARRESRELQGEGRAPGATG
jgi:glycosyltransferase involved in cell wall biosynthesis